MYVSFHSIHTEVLNVKGNMQDFCFMAAFYSKTPAEEQKTEQRKKNEVREKKQINKENKEE